jgi:hypothetical protein
MSKRPNPPLLLAACLILALLVIGLPPNTAQAQTTTKTFKTIADTFIISLYPNNAYGGSSITRVDGSPVARTYLRFTVSGLKGATVRSAILRVYATSSNSSGITVSRLNNNTWKESTLTYKNAPPPGTALKTSPAITAGRWVAINLTGYVKADGTYNLVLTPRNTISVTFAARESGANAAQLVITTGTAAATATAPKPTATTIRPSLTPTTAAPKPTATATRPSATPTTAAPTATATASIPSATATTAPPTATATATVSIPSATPTLKPSPTQTPAGLTRVDLTKGPELIYTGSNTSMKIFWQWNANASFRVDWGASAAYGSSSAAVNAYDTTNHLYTYTITGLTPGAKTFYRVVTGSQYAAGSFLAGPGAAATTLKFVSYGDTRTNPSIHNGVAGQVNALYQSDPAYQTVNAFVGDFVTDGNTDSYWTSQMFDPTLGNIRAELANIALLPAMGNHEGSGALFTRYFPEPFVSARYWSVDYGPAHFILLDQYTSYTSGSAQYNWLKSDLAATNKVWKIVVMHEPGWSAGGGHSNNTTVQNTLEPLFEQYNVAMVLAGHNHYYARAVVNGIQHLTVGTGGAPLASPDSSNPNLVFTYKGYGYSKFEINGNTLTGWLIDTSGAVRDTFTITK